MAKICIDLDMLLSYLLGEKSVVEKINQYIEKEELSITSLTLAELGLTVEDKETVIKISTLFNVLPFDEKAATKAWELYRIVAEERKPKFRIIYNAAIAIVNDAFFLTKDRMSYADIPGLKLI